MTATVENLEWLEASPDIAVAEAEYQRLLGFPAGHLLEGRARELADAARDWYSRHGRPWIFARGVDAVEVSADTLRVETSAFASRRLHDLFHEAGARQAVVVAVSAGPECEARARELWGDDKPDEYFFLEIYGSAVVEHLVMRAGARLCAWADERGLAVLPHYSPGYTGWDVADQDKLLALARRGAAFPRSLEALNTGMLRPKKSLLGLFGLTARLDLAREISRLIPCENCSYTPCQFRRAPFQHAPACVEDVRRLQPAAENAAARSPLSRDAKYSINPRALRKWAGQRLELSVHPDAGVDAVFHYEGTTCSNLGHPLQYDYHIRLGPARDGYPILRAECAPSPGDTGHTSQCEYLSGAESFLARSASEKPLLGRPLNEVLRWPRSYSPAGCYCEAASRLHKWGLVYEVLHFALVERETQSANS